ncbi:aldo/keto reductase [Streptomyces sp. NPDC005426]|uniref:aldo/keto reductase n=1 Tax=Streptomyces sp. NPDC005426 TaxID=3155344 RepID=UPI0033B33BEC
MKGPQSARLFLRAAPRAPATLSRATSPSSRWCANRRAQGIAPGQPALTWVLAQEEKIVTLPGTKRVVHLEENVAAADVQPTDSELADIQDLLPKAVGDRCDPSWMATLDM